MTLSLSISRSIRYRFVALGEEKILWEVEVPVRDTASLISWRFRGVANVRAKVALVLYDS